MCIKCIEPLSFDSLAETNVVRRFPTSVKVFVSTSAGTRTRDLPHGNHRGSMKIIAKKKNIEERKCIGWHGYVGGTKGYRGHFSWKNCVIPGRRDKIILICAGCEGGERDGTRPLRPL